MEQGGYIIENGYYWDGYQWKPVPQEAAAPMSDTDQAAFNLAKPLGGLGGMVAGSKLVGALSGPSAPAITNIATSMGPVSQIPGAGAGIGAQAGLGATGAGTTAGAGAGTAAAAAPGGLGAVGSVAAPLAAGAAAAGLAYNYGGRQVLDGKANSGDYFNLALQSNPITLGINPVLDAAGLGSASKVLGIGTIDPEHAKRDSMRDHLRDKGFFHRTPDGGSFDFVKLADGTMFNTGNESDRADKFGDWAGERAGQPMHWYDLNWEDPTGGDIKDESSQANMVGRLNPLAAILTGGDDQLSGQLVGYLQNAATSNGQGQENLQSFYNQAGLDDRTNAINMVNELRANDAISDWEQVAYHNAINMQFGDDGSGSYDYSKLGGDPSAVHKSAFDLHFGNKTPEQVKKEEEEKQNSGDNYYLE